MAMLNNQRVTIFNYQVWEYVPGQPWIVEHKKKKHVESFAVAILEMAFNQAYAKYLRCWWTLVTIHP